MSTTDPHGIQKIADALGLGKLLTREPTHKENHELANQGVWAADSLHRQLSAIDAQTVRLSDYLLKRTPDHGIDFSFLDPLQKKLDDVVAAYPDACYVHNGAPCSLAAAADELRGAIALAAPYRAIPRPTEAKA